MPVAGALILTAGSGEVVASSTLGRWCSVHGPSDHDSFAPRSGSAPHFNFTSQGLARSSRGDGWLVAGGGEGG